MADYPDFKAAIEPALSFERTLRSHLGLAADAAVPWSFALKAVKRELDATASHIETQVANYNDAMRDAMRRASEPDVEHLLTRAGDTSDMERRAAEVREDSKFYADALSYARAREAWDPTLKERFSAWMRDAVLEETRSSLGVDNKFKSLEVIGDTDERRLELTYTFKMVDPSKMPSDTAAVESEAVWADAKGLDPPWIFEADHTDAILYIDWQRSEIRDGPYRKPEKGFWRKLGEFLLVEAVTTIALGGVLKGIQLVARGAMRIGAVRRGVQLARLASSRAAEAAVETATAVMKKLKQAVPSRQSLGKVGERAISRPAAGAVRNSERGSIFIYRRARARAENRQKIAASTSSPKASGGGRGSGGGVGSGGGGAVALPKYDPSQELMTATGDLTDNGVAFLRSHPKFKKTLGQLDDTQIRAAFHGNAVAGVRRPPGSGALLEQVIKEEVRVVWIGQTTKTRFLLAKDRQTMKQVVNAIWKVDARQRGKGAVLSMNVEKYLRTHPALKKEFEAVENALQSRWKRMQSSKAGTRQAAKEFEEWEKFLRKDVGKSEPDIVEVMIDQGEAYVFDPTHRINEAAHNLKSGFYKAVLEDTTKLKVQAVDYRAVLRATPIGP